MTCQVLYHIRKEGPSEDSEETVRTVYAGDLTNISDQMFDIRDEHKNSSDRSKQRSILELYAFATSAEAANTEMVLFAAVVHQHCIAKLNKPEAKVLFDLDLQHRVENPSTRNFSVKTRQ